MVNAVVEKMKANGVKTVAYIGFTDAWGDLVYDAAAEGGRACRHQGRRQRALRAARSVGHRPGAEDRRAAPRRGDGPAAPERPARCRSSPLQERGFKGGVYGNHGMINPDFLRVAGSSGERRASCRPGPVIVARPLPANYPTRKVLRRFRAAFLKVNGAPVDRRVLSVLVRRLPRLRRRRRARDRRHQGPSRERRRSGSRCATPSPAPRKSSARTASTTSRPATSTASTSARASSCGSTTAPGSTFPETRGRLR
jgi:hypothetical protein